MTRRLGWFASLAAFVLGCGSVVSVPAESEGGDGSTSSAGTPSTGTPSTSTASPVPDSDTMPVTTAATVDPDPTTRGAMTTGSTGPTTFGSTTDDDPACMFICRPDGGLPSNACDIWDPDCPRGQKCTAWSNDGGDSWNANRCVPVVSDPAGLGEPCVVEGAATSGFDDCDFGLICLADPDTLEGTCVPFCEGPAVNPTCADGRICVAGGDTVIPLCLPECDPLDPACASTEGCTPFADDFVCTRVYEGLADFEPCAFINACAAGSSCLPADDVGACPEGASGCCAPYCDLSVPVCPESTTCLPYFDPPVPGFEDLGFCGAP